MKFLFRKNCKNGKPYSEKLPWIVIQTELLEARLGNGTVNSRGNSRCSSKSNSRSSSPTPGERGSGWCGWLCGWLCVVRLAQLTLLLTLVAAAAHILIAALTAGVIPTPSPRPRPLLPSLHDTHLPRPPISNLLDIQDFRYTHEAEDACTPTNLYFVFLVHSRPDHFRQRQAIRATWGGYHDLEGGWAARTVFMLGQGSGGGGEGDKGTDVGGLQVSQLVEQEARRYGDLVVGSFQDHYHNLTYKHIMTLGWATARCPHASFLVKADDDAFIDVPALKALLDRTFGGSPPRRTLACNVLPAGTQPQRTGKWAVSVEDYPYNEYPRYCAGLAYVATPDVAEDLYRAAHADVAPRIWVDDVWVTGLLAECMRLQPHYLNLRYTYDHTEMVQWVDRARSSATPPYTFAHLDPACPDWRPTLYQLWHHALNAHNTSATHDR